AVNTTPGTPATAAITVTNVGNVTVTALNLTVTLPPGLSLTGLAPVSLAVGQSTTLTITLTPDASTPLNSTLSASIAAVFPGADVPPKIVIPVRVAVPGVAAIGDASVAAKVLGNAGLANRLNDLV